MKMSANSCKSTVGKVIVDGKIRKTAMNKLRETKDGKSDTPIGRQAEKPDGVKQNMRKRKE